MSSEPSSSNAVHTTELPSSSSDSPYSETPPLHHNFQEQQQQQEDQEIDLGRSALSHVGNDEEGRVRSDPERLTLAWCAASCATGMHQFHEMRQVAGRFVNNKDVQLFIVALIGINGIMMGIGTFDFIRDNEIANAAFEMIDQIFLIIFTMELGLQFLYHGWQVFLDGWLTFDFIIITVSWSFSSVQIVRAFRIFRALRLITRIKVMKNLILGT